MLLRRKECIIDEYFRPQFSLLPLPSGIVIASVQPTTTSLVVQIASRHPCAACPLCGQSEALVALGLMRWLVDEVYPEARVIRLMMDNLNTHYVTRNAQQSRILWRYTCADARAQMHDLYPSPKFKLD